MKPLTIEKGIIITNRALALNISKEELITLFILFNFKKDKFKENNKNPLIISKKSLYNLIPFDRRSIKKYLFNLEQQNLLTYKEEIYYIKFDIKIHLSKEYKKLGYIFIPKEILYNKNLSSSEKLILSYLRGYTKDGLKCNKTNKDIIYDLKISKRTLDRALNKFKKLNLIETESHGRNVYIGTLNNNITNYFKNADIREIKTANITKVNNINNIEHAIFITDDSLLNKLDKSTLLQYKKEMDEKLINLINKKGD